MSDKFILNLGVFFRSVAAASRRSALLLLLTALQPLHLNVSVFTFTAANGLLLLSANAVAEIRSQNSPRLRLRMGSNSGTVDTVQYAPGIPPFLTPLGAGVSEAESISTNNITGGQAGFTVRVQAFVNAKSAAEAPLQGTFSYDSSAGMTCTTPATCGVENIPMTHIAWDTQDSDTLNTVLQYNGGSNQVFQTQTDTNPANGGTNNRHLNRYQFRFINDTLYPAGTYEGTVVVTGVAF